MDEQHFSMTTKSLGFHFTVWFLHLACKHPPSIHHPHPHSKGLDRSNLEVQIIPSQSSEHYSIWSIGHFFSSLLVASKHDLGWYSWQWVKRGYRKQMRRDGSPKPLHIWCCIKGIWDAPIRPDGVMSWPLPQPMVFLHCIMTDKPASCQQSGPERGMKMAHYENMKSDCVSHKMFVHIQELLQACHKNITLRLCFTIISQ